MDNCELCEKIISLENKISDIKEYITISKQTETENDSLSEKTLNFISEKEKEVTKLENKKKYLIKSTIFENMSYSELHEFRDKHQVQTTEEELFDFA